MLIRPALESDLDDINRIYNEEVRASTFAFDTKEGRVAERQMWFAAHRAPYSVVVAECERLVVGWASLSPWAPHDAYTSTAEHSFYVDRRYRGRGVGRALLDAIVREAEVAGFHVLVGRITAGNAASRYLHGACGFSEVGIMREVGRKCDRWLDVWLVQRILIWCVAACVVIGSSSPAVAQVDQQRAQEYFKEAQALCERDNGRLWGVSICAPMVIGDARTQTFATSQPPPDAPRPRLIGLVNGPIQWGDRRWAAAIWDTIANWPARTRGELLLHESFHIVQPRLVPNGPAGANEHLDAVDGRYWLRLEWRALARALRERGDPRTLAVRDALAFRQARHTRYPDKVESERVLYILEGLASYTQTVLVAPSQTDAIARGLELLAGAEDGESFVGTFTYNSGPAYGLLLDAASPGWPRTVRGSDDPPAMLMRALGVQPVADAAAAAARYGGAEVRAAEEQREQQRQARIAELRQRFVDGPVFVMPCGGGGTSNSLGAVVIPGAGTVYFHPFRRSGPCGTLAAENGVLAASDGVPLRLPAPVRGDDVTISGDGWTFRAAAGWVVREGARRGDYEAVRQQP